MKLKNLRLQFLLKISLILLFFFFNFPVKADPNVTRTDFTITLNDGVVLDCSKFIPDMKAPKDGFPAIIFCHGYGRTKEDQVHEASEQTKFGYYTMCYTMRGQGFSGGYSNLISTVEMNDFMQVIDFIKTEPNVNGSKIGAAGSSQGGIIPFMAACNGAPLSCVISDLSSPEFATSWIENGCVKITFVWALSYDTTIVRYSDDISQYRGWALSNDPGDWDNLAYNLPRGRDFMDKVADCNVPMLISNTWQDKYFNALGMIKAKDLLRPPFRMYFGSMNGHGSQLSEGEKKLHSAYEATWLANFLTTRPTGVMKMSKFVYQLSTFKDGALDFTHFESPTWEPSGVKKVPVYFSQNNTLSYQPGDNSYSSFKNIYSEGMSLLQAIYYAFTGPGFDSHFTKDGVSFDSDPLDRETTMEGTPQLNLYYSSDASVCQYNFQIWEVMQDGSANFVSSINYTDRHNSPNQVNNRIIDGNAIGHIFKKGSKIRVVATNLDTRTNDAFLRTYPFVLPVLGNSENKIEMGSGNASCIILPLK